jgi:hypothetical protein
LAETLGVSVKGVAEGIGTLGRKGIEGLGETGKGLGHAIGGLFGGTKKK